MVNFIHNLVNVGLQVTLTAKVVSIFRSIVIM